MDHFRAGIMLTIIGLFLGFITYKKSKFFWEFFNTRWLRKILGDDVTLIALYLVSGVLVITGLLLANGIIR